MGICSPWIRAVFHPICVHLRRSTSWGGSEGEHVYKSNCHRTGKFSWQGKGLERSVWRANNMTSDFLKGRT